MKISMQSGSLSRFCWVFMLLVVSLWVLVCPAEEWHIETVDSVGIAGWYTSLALDSSDNPRIAYLEADNIDLKFASHDGREWCIERVDSLGESSWGISLALDDDIAHISYVLFESLLYAYKDSSGWHTEAVPGECSGLPSMVLDGQGFPHIAHMRGYPYDEVRYAYRDEVCWHFQFVNVECNVSHISLALNNGTFPHISCYGEANLMYVFRDDSGWHIEMVDSLSGLHTSLALDQNSHPHIGFSDGNDLKYAYRYGSAWHIETADTLDDAGYFTSLVLDTLGYPHIAHCVGQVAYWLWVPDMLRYVYKDNTGWHSETVDSEGEVGMWASLALDADGRPHISYHDATDGDLKYAYLGPLSTERAPAVGARGAVRLLRVSPNPASEGTSILFVISDSKSVSAPVRLRVYDSLGRLVATPAEYVADPGRYSTQWDLCSGRGIRVPCGAYYLRVEGSDPGASDLKKLVVVR
jgi:hypothetical protein